MRLELPNDMEVRTEHGNVNLYADGVMESRMPMPGWTLGMGVQELGLVLDNAFSYMQVFDIVAFSSTMAVNLGRELDR